MKVVFLSIKQSVMATWKLDNEQIAVPAGGVHLKWENRTYFTLTYKGKKFRGEVMRDLREEGKLEVKLNHRVFLVQKEGPLDALIEAMGMDKPKVRKLKQLKAPMPGRVVGIAVQIGDEINVGDPLLTLEAMKMENVLKAEGTGKVNEIKAIAQGVVEKGSVLIEFE